MRDGDCAMVLLALKSLPLGANVEELARLLDADADAVAEVLAALQRDGLVRVMVEQ